jgi:c-di-GMP-binding flagellar brake protein YcgR
VLFETNLDKVRIQFSVQQITACLQDGRPALRAPFPESIRRVQRREYYRVEVPVTEPAWCTIPMPQGKIVKLEIKDISAGGISVLDNSHLLDTSEDMLYKDCRLELPETGTVVADLQIKRSLHETLSNDKKIHMLGCRFHDLSNPMNFMVQQYIGKLERKLNAKRRGFE